MIGMGTPSIHSSIPRPINVSFIGSFSGSARPCLGPTRCMISDDATVRTLPRLKIHEGVNEIARQHTKL